MPRISTEYSRFQAGIRPFQNNNLHTMCQLFSAFNRNTYTRILFICLALFWLHIKRLFFYICLRMKYIILYCVQNNNRQDVKEQGFQASNKSRCSFALNATELYRKSNNILLDSLSVWHIWNQMLIKNSIILLVVKCSSWSIWSNLKKLNQKLNSKEFSWKSLT